MNPSGPDSGIPDPKDVDLSLKRFDTLFRYLAMESTLYWSRSQFFLVANAALLGFLTSFLRSLGTALTAREVVGLCVLAAVGFCVSILWYRAIGAGDRWHGYWQKQCIVFEKTAFGYPVLSQAREEPDHRSVAKIVRYSVWVFLVVWPIILVAVLALYFSGSTTANSDLEL